MTRVAKSARITGRVQGVFFRQSASDEARRLGVAGWVRNCTDGSVEAHVEGEELAVEAMVAWLRRGPSHARVEDAEIRRAQPEGLTSFEIRH